MATSRQLCSRTAFGKTSTACAAATKRQEWPRTRDCISSVYPEYVASSCAVGASGRKVRKPRSSPSVSAMVRRGPEVDVEAALDLDRNSWLPENPVFPAPDDQRAIRDVGADFGPASWDPVSAGPAIGPGMSKAGISKMRAWGRKVAGASDPTTDATIRSVLDRCPTSPVVITTQGARVACEGFEFNVSRGTRIGDALIETAQRLGRVTGAIPSLDAPWEGPGVGYGPDSHGTWESKWTIKGTVGDLRERVMLAQEGLGLKVSPSTRVCLGNGLSTIHPGLAVMRREDGEPITHHGRIDGRRVLLVDDTRELPFRWDRNRHNESKGEFCGTYRQISQALKRAVAAAKGMKAHTGIEIDSRPTDNGNQLRIHISALGKDSTPKLVTTLDRTDLPF